MKRKRHTPEEIIKKLREAATLLAAGQGIEEVCRKIEVSPPTFHRWKQEYGGAKEETIKRLKDALENGVEFVEPRQRDVDHGHGLATGPVAGIQCHSAAGVHYPKSRCAAEDKPVAKAEAEAVRLGGRVPQNSVPHIPLLSNLR